MEVCGNMSNQLHFIYGQNNMYGKLDTAEFNDTLILKDFSLVYFQMFILNPLSCNSCLWYAVDN